MAAKTSEPEPEQPKKGVEPQQDSGDMLSPDDEQI